jgi:hypothetical protein
MPSDEQLLASIFPIRSAIDSGTCFLFGDHSHVLTARHVVTTAAGDAAPNLTVEVETGKSEPAAIQQILAFGDVALVRLGREISAAPLLPGPAGKEPDPGSPIRAAGFPLHVAEKWHPGKLAGRSGLGEYEILYEHSVTSQLSGLSGAPVFDSTNRVIGVLTQHDALTPSAVKMVPLEDFRDYLDFSPPPGRFTCHAFFSDQEPPAGGNLRTAIKDAIGVLKAQWDQDIELTCQPSAEAVASREAYLKAVRVLCRADVCIFDLTRYEPAVMLLLGIRSVVKRGLTIASAAGGFEDVPYDIKELNLLSHSETSPVEKPLHDLLTARIHAWRDAESLEHYLDLPTFEAVRNLPPGGRGEVRPEQSVLLLCSYKGSDAAANLKYLRGRLAVQLQKRKIFKPSIDRVMDLNQRSPWLVSQNMYEAIRRTSLCIADWSGAPEWSANVFFELGVRIAVRKGCTLCLLRELEKGEAAAELTAQQQALLDLFQPLRYRLSDADGISIEKAMTIWDRYESGQPEADGGPCTYTYRQITAAIDERQGLLATPVAVELLRSARLLSADDSEALSAVLYPENPRLGRAATSAAAERLWAAWDYMLKRYQNSELVQDKDLNRIMMDVGRALLDLFGDADPAMGPVKATISKLVPNEGQ